MSKRRPTEKLVIKVYVGDADRLRELRRALHPGMIVRMADLFAYALDAAEAKNQTHPEWAVLEEEVEG